ncbi:zinc ribbon domain-containing protein [Altibacter lentus]|uniref:zinc ribbon domain-containing protein n=1 Tax=Altibacter lentus TaxID=1223410 RepID=UPI001268197E|nr:zinc ribbon domain-containing protein [Altibacter lentus]
MEEILIPAVHCSQCDTQLIEKQVFCTACGYPERGSEAQRSGFHAKRVIANQTSQNASKRIKSARNSLYVVAGLSLFWGLIYFFRFEDSATLIATGILAVIYLALGYWSQKRPLIALVLGLLVFLTIVVIDAILDPSTIYKGIIIKILVIGYLAKGINSAMQLRNI